MLTQHAIHNSGEDTHMAYQLGQEQTYTVMAVFDGHGGRDVAAFCQAMLREELDARLLNRSMDKKEAVRATLQSLQARVSHSKSGCAATIVVIVDNETIVSANVGDAMAVLYECESQILLTDDHRIAHNPGERDALTSRGAHIAHAATPQPRGTLRSWPGGLAMSRCIGDADCPHAVHTPAVYEYAITDRQNFAVVVCSDGVWDALSFSQVRKMCRQGTTAMRVAQRAWKQSQNDDVTCLMWTQGHYTHRSSPRLLPRIWSYSSNSSIDDDAIVLHVPTTAD